MEQSRLFGYAYILFAAVLILLGLVITVAPPEWWGFSEEAAKLIGWRRVVAFGLLGYVGGHSLVRAKRHFAPVGLKGMTGPIILWLRSFQDDDLHVQRQGRDKYLWWMRMPADRLEEEIVDKLREHGDVVAVGSPGEQIPQLGCTRVYFEDAEWQSGVSELIERSKVILWICGGSPGVRWEFDQAFARNFYDRLIAIIPPRSDVAEGWSRLREWAATHEVSLPGEATAAPAMKQVGDGRKGTWREAAGPPGRLVYAVRFEAGTRAPRLYWGDANERGRHDTSEYPRITAEAVLDLLAQNVEREKSHADLDALTSVAGGDSVRDSAEAAEQCDRGDRRPSSADHGGHASGTS